MQDSLIDQVAWIGRPEQGSPVRGIVLRFSGLGATGMKSEPDDLERAWSEAGGLVVLPYHDPWAWMNPPTRAFVDELLDSLRMRYRLDRNLPLIATGCSMGGHGALLYPRYSRHRVTACLAMSPVCDLPFHYGERPDLPRTMHHAFGTYGDLTDQLIRHSPLHQAAFLPDIPYLIVHGEKDTAVAKGPHSDALVRALGEQGLTAEYRESAEMGHCGPLDEPMLRRVTEFVIEQLRRTA